MSKNPKMVICRNCNSPIPANAKRCPNCGTKNTKPFYKKWWFICLVVLVVLGAVGQSGGNDKKTGAITGQESSNASSASRETEPQRGSSMAEPSSTEPEAPPASSSDASSDTAPESVPEEAPEPESSSTELVDGMRPEFKEAMDSYEAFFDQYCEFMESYDQSNIAMLAEYAELLKKEADVQKKFEEWDSSDMNNTELAYYLQVQTNVNQKLLKVME